MAPRPTSSRRSANAITASLLFSTAIVAPVASHALPRQTMRPTGTMDIQSWPLQPTMAPAIPAVLVGRDFNTVCGYIGGNPDLPATCMAGSHCVVDPKNKAIGCCPDEGDCATGIFTGCADSNNPGQGVVDPHIFTCGAGDVCYKNTFEGGYFQYGCGSATNMATTVALTASGESSIAHTSVSVSLRPTTTLASTTGGSSSSTSGRLQGANKSNSSSKDEEGNSHSHTGAIVGGVIGGLAALLILLALGIWLWRRNKRSATPEAEEEPNRPLASPETDYEGSDDMTDTRPAPKPPGSGRQYDDTESWPIPPATKGGIIGGVQIATDTDQTPLTHENALSPTNNINNFAPVNTGSVPRRGGERPFWQQTGGGRTRNLTRS
ncbi:hypothetical protein PWT90_06546 [Aphanocladium album]|nr:hypothetical protein PWT90_06546 [Aphanocladium album]